MEVFLEVACVAGVERGRRRVNWGAREGERKGKERSFPSSLLPRAWSRDLIPFPFPFERLPRRLFLRESNVEPKKFVWTTSTAFSTGSVPSLSGDWKTPEHARQAKGAREGWWERAQSASGECWEGKEERGAFSPLPVSPFVPAFLNNKLKYPQVIARDWGRGSQ